MLSDLFLRATFRGSFIRLGVVLLALTIPGCSPDQPADDSAPVDEKKTEVENKEPLAQHRHTNLLANETSPYLLMHAHNPVNWHPWGEEAFAKAKKEKKLVFLSIGYSSCYWCHVMERESFMDEEIAAFLNKHYVCIKVDREERPDVDAIYMTALQLLSGRGGWPMSMFLTPQGKPFTGGTYFPARDGDRGASTGFLSIIKQFQSIWEEEPEKAREVAEALTKALNDQSGSARPVGLVTLDEKLLASVQQGLADNYDHQFGGFGYSPAEPSRPKFPEPSNLFFLLDRVRRTQDKQAEQLLLGTLEHMADGGIRDHFGGGFHRYSTDRFWRIPHFEKMLYDNGQLASVYAEAFQITKREDFKRVVDELLSFVLQEMTNEQGAFYSSLDAESEQEEGKFYRWEKKELEELLTKEERTLLGSIYGFEELPNFEENYYAPQLAKPLHQIARDRKTTEQDLEAQLVPLRRKLFLARAKRPRPLTDTKILTSWNGLMIRGFADAGRIFNNRQYLQAAEKAAYFLLDHLRTSDNRLLRTYSQNQAKLNAYLDDYAFLVDGLIALYQATNHEHWLHAADQLTGKQIELFWDDRNGGFFFTSNDHESLITRVKDPVDGAQPSGNSLAAANLIYLAVHLDRPEYLLRAEKTIRVTASLLSSSPTAAPRMAVAIAALLEAKDKQSQEKLSE